MPLSSFRLLLVAWLAILFASDLDSIVAHAVGLNLPSWGVLVRGAVLAVVAFAIPRRAPLAQLRGFILALAAFCAGSWMVTAIQGQIQWFTVAPRAYGMLVRVFLYLIIAALMALTLVGSGISRRDLFLQSGDLRARTALPLLRGAKWSIVAPVLLILISGGLLAQLWIVSYASQHYRPIALLWGLPAAILFATVNASWEEFCFRCVLLARGMRVVGASQAIAMTSVLFGLAHYFGHPSGLSGVAMAAFFAWIVARSMIDTGGWGYAWLIHFVQDVIIFLMVWMTGS